MKREAVDSLTYIAWIMPGIHAKKVRIMLTTKSVRDVGITNSGRSSIRRTDAKFVIWR